MASLKIHPAISDVYCAVRDARESVEGTDKAIRSIAESLLRSDGFVVDRDTSGLIKRLVANG